MKKNLKNAILFAVTVLGVLTMRSAWALDIVSDPTQATATPPWNFWDVCPEVQAQAIVNMFGNGLVCIGLIMLAGALILDIVHDGSEKKPQNVAARWGVLLVVVGVGVMLVTAGVIYITLTTQLWSGGRACISGDLLPRPWYVKALFFITTQRLYSL